MEDNGNNHKWFHVRLIDSRQAIVLASNPNHAQEKARQRGYPHSPTTSVYQVKYRFAKLTADLILA